jgi:hypothetical protein
MSLVKEYILDKIINLGETSVNIPWDLNEHISLEDIVFMNLVKSVHLDYSYYRLIIKYNKGTAHEIQILEKSKYTDIILLALISKLPISTVFIYHWKKWLFVRYRSTYVFKQDFLDEANEYFDQIDFNFDIKSNGLVILNGFRGYLDKEQEFIKEYLTPRNVKSATKV